MSEKTENQAKNITIKSDIASVQKFYEIHQRLGSATQAETFQNLICNFYKPYQVEDNTAELQKQLETLQAELDDAKNTILQLENDNRISIQKSANELEQVKNDFETYKGANEMRENEYRIVILPDNLKALDYVCNRESQRRAQPWSRSHVINHFIFHRFILGASNGDLLSMPDSVCRKLGINLKNKPTPTPPQPEIDNTETLTL